MRHHLVRAALLLTTCLLGGCIRAGLRPDVATIAREYGHTGQSLLFRASTGDAGGLVHHLIMRRRD